MQQYKDQLRVKKRRKLMILMVSFLAFLAVAAAGLVYLLFFSSFFVVKDVRLNVPDKLRQDLEVSVSKWLDDGFWQLRRRNNILFVSSEKLVSRLYEKFPELAMISIDKDFPHGLMLSAVEREPTGVWCSASLKCFYFDKDGIAFEETQKSTGFLILAVTDKRENELLLGEKVTDEVWLDNILQSRELLVKIGVNVSEFIIPAGSFDEFHAVTAEGWPIYFAITTDIEKQINSLTVFLSEKIKPAQRAGLQYIDLRIQDRIYYR